ncbi:hypothetical protein K458DRAFT_393870 [Lentithecium fluviatile CBS 122367]|uniref:Uncharacterized protein n=1 Tax=Lentithecium fluviatile CBS 122367 TaxID=1168545 RepID=A0A6G1IN95_9PLEO|nr:hypothetical protein K458DRAFT_393870 [Lentithecium fluviatile CBS 122367]
MANWRESCRLSQQPDSRGKPPSHSGKVGDLRYMARTSIQTEKPWSKVGDRVIIKRDPVPAVNEDLRTIEKACIDAISETPHGKGPIRMARDHHQELGDIKVVAYHLQLSEGMNGKPRYDMIVEFGK